MDTDRAPKDCSDPTVGRLIYAYHMGDILKEKDRDVFEIHALGCGPCIRVLLKLQREEPSDD